MKKVLVFLSVSMLFFGACVEKQMIHYQSGMPATGKGNGGNFSLASDESLEKLVSEIKDPLEKTFLAMKALSQAELLAPGSTSLSRNKPVLDALRLMTESSTLNEGDIFTNIKTENNLVLSDKPCRNSAGIQHLATTELLGFGQPICLSKELLKTQFTFDSEQTFLINFLGLLAHEFVHHYIDLDSYEENEEIANEVQQFLISELSNATVFDSSKVVSADAFFFVESLLVDSEAVLQRVKENVMLSDREAGAQ